MLVLFIGEESSSGKKLLNLDINSPPPSRHPAKCESLQLVDVLPNFLSGC